MKLLALADRAEIPMVAVTNAPRLNAEMMLSGLGIMPRFKAVIIGDELPHGKPHPMPYLEGLRAVSAAPELSLAFEDSRSGVQVRFRGRHRDDWNTDEPWPWRSGRGRRGLARPRPLMVRNCSSWSRRQWAGDVQRRRAHLCFEYAPAVTEICPALIVDFDVAICFAMRNAFVTTSGIVTNVGAGTGKNGARSRSLRAVA